MESFVGVVFSIVFVFCSFSEHVICQITIITFSVVPL